MPLLCRSPSEGGPPFLLVSLLVITVSLASLGCNSSGPLDEGQCPAESTAPVPDAGETSPDDQTPVEVGLEVSEVTLQHSWTVGDGPLNNSFWRLSARIPLPGHAPDAGFPLGEWPPRTGFDYRRPGAGGLIASARSHYTKSTTISV